MEPAHGLAANPAGGWDEPHHQQGHSRRQCRAWSGRLRDQEGYQGRALEPGDQPSAVRRCSRATDRLASPHALGRSGRVCRREREEGWSDLRRRTVGVRCVRAGGREDSHRGRKRAGVGAAHRQGGGGTK